jgi:hypothetical protein
MFCGEMDCVKREINKETAAILEEAVCFFFTTGLSVYVRA